MNDRAPHVYDKAKYHVESVSDGGLPESHASNHIVPMLRWLIEHNLMSEFFHTEGADELARYRAGEEANYARIASVMDARHLERRTPWDS